MKQAIPRECNGGVDVSVAPHQIADNRWLKTFNVRSLRGKLQQIPRKRVIQNLNQTAQEGQLLVNIPTNTRDETLQVMVTRETMYQVRPNSSFVEWDAVTAFVPGMAIQRNGYVFTSILAGTNKDPIGALGTTYWRQGLPRLQLGGADVAFDATAYHRWGSCLYSNQLWLTNPLNKLAYTDGSIVRRYSTELPSAVHVEAFFDHLVVGNYTYKGDSRPSGILCSGLYNPSDWDTKQTNEVSRMDFVEFARPDLPLSGLTGLKRSGNILCAYLPSAIVGIQYVGLPNVYRWDPITEDQGNAFRYGLARHKNTHFFFDPVEQDFVAFSAASGFESIGARVLDYFLDSINPSFDLYERTYAFTVPELAEVWWVYVSNESSGAFDRAVVYNWKTKEWYLASVEGRSGVGGYAKRAKTCDELSGTCDSLGDTPADYLSVSGESLTPRLFLDTQANLLREEVPADPTAGAVVQEQIRLETKDLIYGSYDTIKEVDAVRLEATYAGNCTGVEVFAATRDKFEDPVVYKSLGMWLPTLVERRFTFAAINGRVIRFAFEPRGEHVRDFKLSVVSDTVYDGKADK